MQNNEDNNSINLLSMSLNNVKKKWIDLHLKKISKEANVGCGQYYELYEINYFSAIGGLIKSNINSLNDVDLNYIKEKTGYTEDWKPYSETDNETGEERTIYDIIREDEF